MSMLRHGKKEASMSIKNAAEITTDRLYLRPFHEEDAEITSFNSKQPKVAAQMSDMVLETTEAAIEWISQTRTWFNIDDDICQVLAIERIEDGKLLGLVGVAAKDNLGGEVEVLFGITDLEQNKGYATEALQALSGWTFSHCKINYLVAIIKPDNIASQKVVEKSGFKYMEQRELEYDGKITIFNYYRLYCPA
jgi:ribosomal-protein-alanine N-acetyltransferase